MEQSYDYRELIDELKEEIWGDLLNVEEEIQVLRGDETIGEGYHPIIDWYYSQSKMERMLTELSKEEKEQYVKDFDQLEKVTVGDCLSEMTEWNKVI